MCRFDLSRKRSHPEKMPSRLVCYSVTNCGEGPHLDQLLRSTASLRQYNTNIPVWVFVYGDMPPAAAALLEANHICVKPVGTYVASLRKLSPHAEVLSSYGVLCKYLSLAELADVDVAQLLLVDCDTFFFGDVTKLFERHAECECYGREEPFSPYSAHSDAAYLDPAALAALLKSEALHEVPTLNAGALLLNRGLHRKVAPMLGFMLDYASRLMMWLRLHHDGELPYMTPEFDPKSGPGGDPVGSAKPSHSPLPYPSSNAWIVDEVAFWMMLGRLPEVSCGIFAWHDFLQGQEFRSTSREQTSALGCHYFSVNEDVVTDWVKDRAK
jgi:hypothetical protein